jgi:hypothetical protein
MPAARAIRSKSGLPPANALRAFRFYPYCFASPAATHIVQATHANAEAKPAQRVSLLSPVVNEKIRVAKYPPHKKL